jgi:hypothetical protein
MKPIHAIDPVAASRIRYVLFDIDDTITTGGKVTARAYDALWRLHDAGYIPIPVTGRPAGWCDLIVRQWPVAAVVGENGAFVFYFSEERLCTYTHPDAAPEGSRQRLDAVLRAAAQKVPGCRAAKDQPYRLCDLAIDYNEDPPHLGLGAAEEIRAVCASMGAEAKISSIHVNAWFGKYDKLSTTLSFLCEMGETRPKETVFFLGDSPNDEPMFEYFPMSCGVANVKPFVPMMKHLPAYIAPREGGEGFADAIAHFLSVCDHAPNA